MKMFRVLFTVSLIGCLLMIVPGSLSQKTANSEEILDRSIANLDLTESITIREAFTRGMVETGVLGCIYIWHDCEGQRKYLLNPSDQSLRGLLNTIITADPSYKWEISEGVVNIIPREKEAQFLNTTISGFEIQAKTLPVAVNQFFNTPEIEFQWNRLIKEGGWQAKSYGVGADYDSDLTMKKVSLSMTNVTMREALNAMARAHGSVIWVVNEGNCIGAIDRRVFSVGFITFPKSKR